MQLLSAAAIIGLVVVVVVVCIPATKHAIVYLKRSMGPYEEAACDNN